MTDNSTTRKKKDQFVIAYVPTEEAGATVLPYAVRLSQVLNKGLILLHIDDRRYSRHRMDEGAMQALCDRWEGATAAVGKPCYCILQQPTRKAIGGMATVLNAVVAVAAVDGKARRGHPTHPKEVLHNFVECKVAYLTVQKGRSSEVRLGRVAFSVDFHKESKEKLAWASYFARFAGSQLCAYYDQYSDSGLKAKWYNNMKFMTKFFNSLGITYTPRPTTVGTALFPEVVLMRQAIDEGNDVIISSATDPRAIDVVEFIVGTQERRIIVNSSRTPVLFLNPRDDIYVLCD